MNCIKSQPLRCPLCGRGRVIDMGPMASTGQFMLCGPEYVQHAQLIAKCPKCGHQIGIRIIQHECVAFLP